ncbi:MAG: hypothetical protein KAV82_03270 [Phycisphaerae bacterium]|nr:hypothetical protein [Phycisphaerae bacterium]
MRKLVCVAVLAAVVTTAYADPTLKITMWADHDTAGVGDVISYEVRGELTVEPNLGLALWGGDVSFGTYPVGAALTAGAGMASFVKDAGLTNPDGYGGTVSGAVLLQVGGGQNTIGNDIGNAPYPIGAVVEGIAAAEIVLATGTYTMGADDLTIAVSECFANVLEADQGGGVYSVLPGVCDLVDVSVTIGAGAPPEIVGSWYSYKTHGTTGELSIEFNQTATGNSTTPMDTGGAGIETRRGSITKLTCTFNQAMDDTSFAVTDIEAVGCAHAAVNPSSIAFDATKMVLTMNFAAGAIANGEAPSTPDRYTITIADTVLSAAGANLAGDRDVQAIAQYGNVFNFGASAGRTNSTDVNQISSRIGYLVPSQAAPKYDIFYLVIPPGPAKVTTTDYNQASSNQSGPICP